MADNLTTGTTLATIPSGTVIATDDVSGVQFQKVKLIDGTADSATVIAAGGGVEAGALRVTIANDSTGVVSVDDNGSSLTVDGTVAVTLAAGAAAIAKAEDVASANADVGVPAMMIRKATPANTSDTDGDYEMLQGSAGRLWTSTVVDTALPAGTNAIGKLAANTGVTIGAVELAAAQTLATVTTVSTVTSVTAIGTSVTPGTSAAHLGKAEDAAAASGDTGVAMLAVRRDTPSSDVSAAGDYATPQVSANGELWVNISPSASSFTKAEDAAAASGDVGVPVWSVRRDTPTASAAAGDYSEINSNAQGALWVSLTPNSTGGVTVNFFVAANTTNATNIKASAGAIYGWNVTNEGTAWAYLKFHNTASAPTAGSGVAYSVGIPPGGGSNESIPEGIPFGTGIGVTVVAGIAAADATAVPASKITINVRFK